MQSKKFTKFLNKKGLKYTSERRLIMEEVCNTEDHFEAEDISISLRTKGKRVSRASVYRTLPLLVESGLLREVHSNEKHSHYEQVVGQEHHDHLICTQCGDTIEFFDEEIERLQERVCKAKNFNPTYHKLEIIGVCDQCAENSE